MNRQTSCSVVSKSQKNTILIGRERRLLQKHQLPPVTPPKSKVLTEKEETLIKSVVNVDDSTNMSTIKEITQKLSDTQASPKQIYDKVRSLNRYSPAKSKQEKQKQVKLFFCSIIPYFPITRYC